MGVPYFWFARSYIALRYVVDPALLAVALRLDVDGVIKGGDLLGRLLDTFVAAELRAELVVCATRPRLFHLRLEQGRRELDLVAELGGGRIVGIEVKASASVGLEDAKHLAWLREACGDRFCAGVVFHTGSQDLFLGRQTPGASYLRALGVTAQTRDRVTGYAFDWLDAPLAASRSSHFISRPLRRAEC